ncbi:hypothetical protein LV469_02870 [Peptoniphilus sp. GNH]|nr:hypothetical protein LV469_02870 [Peptoniphilus sp. GNH]
MFIWKKYFKKPVYKERIESKRVENYAVFEPDEKISVVGNPILLMYEDWYPNNGYGYEWYKRVPAGLTVKTVSSIAGLQQLSWSYTENILKRDGIVPQNAHMDISDVMDGEDKHVVAIKIYYSYYRDEKNTYIAGYTKGDFIEEVKSSRKSDYPLNGEFGDFYYEFINAAPLISGSNYDYGVVNSDFSIKYVVTDSDDGDAVKVKIVCDGKILKDFTKTSLGVKKELYIDLSKYDLGKHKIEIIAKDKQGEISTRTYTFEKINSAPIISGTDADLGNKNSAFTIVYTVKDPNNDKVNVIEKLNGKILKNITNIGTGEQSITITAKMLSEFAINVSNTIEIEARDANNAVSYRRFTFARSNFAPIISGTDTDLGEKDKEFTYAYSVTDEEKDEIKIKAFLDNRLVVPEFDGVDNKEYKYELKGFDFLKLTLGKHTLKIVATDSNGLVSTRLVSFTRTAARLIMQLKVPRDTDVMAKKVLVIPGWFVAPFATGRVEVCNNAYDTEPTWEDATAVTNEGRAFNFLNTSKTDTKWGVNIRLTIEKGKSTVTSYITSIGGSVE